MLHQLLLPMPKSFTAREKKRASKNRRVVVSVLYYDLTEEKKKL